MQIELLPVRWQVRSALRELADYTCPQLLNSSAEVRGGQTDAVIGALAWEPLIYLPSS